MSPSVFVVPGITTLHGQQTSSPLFFHLTGLLSSYATGKSLYQPETMVCAVLVPVAFNNRCCKSRAAAALTLVPEVCQAAALSKLPCLIVPSFFSFCPSRDSYFSPPTETLIGKYILHLWPQCPLPQAEWKIIDDGGGGWQLVLSSSIYHMCHKLLQRRAGSNPHLFSSAEDVCV